MPTDDMKKTTDRWRRDAEKRRQRSNETPEEGRARVQKEIDQMVKRSKKPPKSDEDLKRERDREIEKLKKQSAESRRRGEEMKDLSDRLQDRQTEK